MTGVVFQMGIFGYCFLIASNFPFKAKDQRRHLASTRKTNEVRLRFLSITMDRLQSWTAVAKTPIQSAEVNKKAEPLLLSLSR